MIFSIADRSVVSADEAVWGQFQNGGLAVADEDWLPTSWSPESNIAWTAEIQGYGQSTPIVAHDQIVVTSTSGAEKDDYHVASFAMDGTKKWQVDRTNPSPFKNSPMVSRAAPSAVATQDGFVAFFEGGVLVGLSTSGDVLWERDLVDQFGKIEARHGLSASLEYDNTNVFVWIERQTDPYVMAIDPATGEEVWKVPGLGSTSWSSPRLISVGEESHLVCSASGKIVGFDPSTGDRLWEFTDISGNTSCTPMPAGDGRFLMGASGGREERNAGSAPQNNTLIKIEKSDDNTFQATAVWRADKATSTFGSPVAAGDTAAFVSRAGVLFRLDLETGERVSNTRIKAGSVWATPIVAGGQIYLFGSKGTTSVVSMDVGKEIATNRCWEIESEAPAFGGGHKIYAGAFVKPYLLIRRGDQLFAVKQ
ncbi:PQQ-binding-like beta-propeller repeat protein [Rubripirellula obstinata]|uniref:outer membrane protein assembly factor BamB family protein n=1 Tax=Rubripirellula obstinata TaxID=406547 RepID=UPI001F327DF7|nr:PQQ-binding-like beta-propeller repeat protein [Rubripirellula obstinata]